MLSREVVFVDGVRTPQGRRNGGLAGAHPTELLGATQTEILARTGADPETVGQVIAGCIGQVGAQSMNVARSAWLSAGLPYSVAATTVDSQCGSSQQAANLGTSLIASGAVDLVLACGVESMSNVPIGSAQKNGPGNPLTRRYFEHYEVTNQFEAAERIADKWGISRRECDEYALESQRRAAEAWAKGHLDREVVAVEAAVRDAEGKRTDQTRLVERDEGIRETSLDALAQLKPVARPDGVLTAGNSSQIADQSSTVLLASAEYAADTGLTARARIVDHCLVGSDPVLMLTGPIDATHFLLKRNGLSMSDIDVVEINEAFASIVLAWARECGPDLATVNPNGGAIAIGHALGSTGTRLISAAVHELERTDKEWALVTMCCGGGLGSGTLIQRV